jgi:hypothetical protein
LYARWRSLPEGRALRERRVAVPRMSVVPNYIRRELFKHPFKTFYESLFCKYHHL